MIWNYLKNALGFVLPEGFFNDKDNDARWEEEENEILNEINNFDNLNIDYIKAEELSCEDLLGYASEERRDLKIDNYLSKTGTITFLCSNYGLIDNKVYFDLDCIGNMVINKNDRVQYITVDSESDEPAKVIKVTPLSKKESWDPFGSQFSTADCDSFTKLKAMVRLVNGRITRLQERKLFIEPHKIWCNMDKIEISYQPIEGDCISIEALVSINRKVHNGVGDVLEVLAIKPSVSQNGTGRVTFWVDGRNEGVINNGVAFSRSVCGDFYIPTLGDLVSYEAIESNQGKLKWRAVWVKPERLKLRQSGERRLFRNKKGIVVTQSSQVLDIKLNDTKEIIVEVMNRGQRDRTLLKVKLFKFDTTSESQLTLKSPNLTEKVTLKPSQKLRFVLICEAKVLGSTGELLEFHFHKFRIAKSFEINVLTEDYIEEVSRKAEPGRVKKPVKRITGPIEGNLVLFGTRPFHTHRFFKMAPKENYDIPKTLWRLMLGPGDVPKSSVEIMNCLRKTLPYLAAGLNPDTYVKRFRTLLHLEEISVRIKFTSYGIVEGVLEQRDSFWFIEVSGLAEGRPSILVGDRVIVTRPWHCKVTHIGFVHKIENNGIYVDFHSEFSLNYQGEKCDVKFMPNMGTLVKCHRAIGRAFEEMGKDWLFPSKVIEKPDSISFEVEDEPVNATKNGSKGNDEKKKLVWQNKKLNERQRMAVVNILKRQARPLPYIIFGPPGTGKTTTVIETIIQLTFLMPETRMLVCGPSNSSVDLLAERLIDSGLFKPGELIRLYAVSRLQLIPEKVAPYSECVGLKTDPTTVKECIQKVKIAKVSLGTFSSIGLLNVLPSFGVPFFTHVFIDEAGQMTEPETMIPVCLLNKEKSQLVLAGDPKQLGPVCSSIVAANFDFERSFLERLISIYPYRADREVFPDTSGFDPRLVTKLNCNYRSLPEIINLPNQLFYDSDLIPLISDVDSYEAKLLERLDLKVSSKREKNPAIIFHGIVGKNLQDRNSPSWFNPQEIWQLVIYLKKLYNSGLTADDIGIVTPYTKQVEKCRNVLASVNLAIPEVGTVNKFQGQEKQVIILSVVRSCLEVLKKDMMFSLGFVASPRRLNVALTRARTLLIILGNPNLLCVDPYWERVIDYCVQNKSYTGCNLKFNVRQLVGDEQNEDSEEEDEDEDEDEDKDEDSRKKGSSTK